MNYEAIALACEQLDHKDKLRLAKLLIEKARKEEESLSPLKRAESKSLLDMDETKKTILKDIDTTEYVMERLYKLKPTKQRSLKNSIKAMFQFHGGLSQSDLDKIVADLQRRKHIKIEHNKILYL